MWEETPEPLDRLRETWWLGLRLADGLSAEDARRRSHDEEAIDPLETTALSLAAEGVLADQAGRFALTEKGLPMADWVARRFLTS